MATQQGTKYVYNKETDASGNTTGFRVSLDQMETLSKTNPQLALKLTKNMAPGESPVSKQDLTALINANQGVEATKPNAADTPPTRSGTATTNSASAGATGTATGGTPTTGKSQYEQTYQDLIDSMGGGKAPEAPDFEKQYKDLQRSTRVDSLQNDLNDLVAQQEELQAQLRQGRQAAIDSVAPMSTIAGRVSEVERAQMERIDAINRQINTKQAQVNAANSTIETTMKLRGATYDAAKDAYHQQMTENLSAMNLVRGILNDQKTDQEKAQDNARSNLQIIYSNLADSGKDLSSLDPATKTTIQSLELQAGLPSGFYGNIAKTDPGGKILSTSTRTSGGGKYADLVLRQPDGSITTKHVYLGADNEGSGSGKLSESEYYQAARSEMSQQLNTKVGSDGKVSPQDYLYARRAWVSKGLSADDFDKAFSNEYAKGAASPLSDYQLNEKADPLASLLNQ